RVGFSQFKAVPSGHLTHDRKDDRARKVSGRLLEHVYRQLGPLLSVGAVSRVQLDLVARGDIASVVVDAEARRSSVHDGGWRANPVPDLGWAPQNVVGDNELDAITRRVALNVEAQVGIARQRDQARIG